MYLSTKPVLVLFIYHSCLLIRCLKPARELASVQYLCIFILKTKSNTTKILAYLEGAQEADYMKKISFLAHSFAEI